MDDEECWVWVSWIQWTASFIACINVFVTFHFNPAPNSLLYNSYHDDVQGWITYDGCVMSIFGCYVTQSICRRTKKGGLDGWDSVHQEFCIWKVVLRYITV